MCCDRLSSSIFQIFSHCSKYVSSVSVETLPSAAHPTAHTKQTSYSLHSFLHQRAKMNSFLKCFCAQAKVFAWVGFYVKPMMTLQQQLCKKVYSHDSSSDLGRMYQCCHATYESASLRMFRLGRTDTIRSASSASAAFVKAFDDPSKQVWWEGCVLHFQQPFHNNWFLPISNIFKLILADCWYGNTDNCREHQVTPVVELKGQFLPNIKNTYYWHLSNHKATVV